VTPLSWVRWSRITRARVLIPLLAAVIFSAWTAHAFAGEPYVVYTANNTAQGAVILRTDPATGSLVEISRNGSQGNLFQNPYDIAVERNGDLVIADMGARNAKDGAVIRVNPFTGKQTVVSSGDLFYDPTGIALAPDGTLYVVDSLAEHSSGAVIRVNPHTGAQEIVSFNFVSLGLFDYSFGVAVDRDGTLVVANRSDTGDLQLPCVPTGSVIRVNPNGGAQSLISALSLLSYPLGVAIDSDESVVVANECPNGTGLVRLGSGGQTAVTPNDGSQVLRTPERVAFTPDRDMLVSDFNGGTDQDGSIVKVTPSGGQSTLSSGPLFNHPVGIAVVRNRPPVASLRLSQSVVAAGKRVDLDASGSRDPEGLTMVYEWDLDGNGSFETASGTTPTAMPLFTSEGVRTLAVRVTDPHGGRSIATARLDVDGSRPVLSGLRADKSSVRLPRAAMIRFRLSEAATVTLGIAKARPGRRLKNGSCSRRAKRGRRCTIWVGVRTLNRSAKAGDNSVRLRTRGLKPGHFRLMLKATDEVGHRSPARSVRLKVNAAHQVRHRNRLR
jgi:sugar lactone lactonase YvrE